MSLPSRRTALLGLALAAAAPILATAPALATTTAPSNATAYQGNAAHDGTSTDGAFRFPLTKAWSRNLGGTVHYPLIVGSRLFIDATLQGGSGTSVAAYDLDSGRRLWGPYDMGGQNGFGALTYDQGRVFQLNGSGQLTALDATTGSRLWFAPITDQYSFTSPPTAAAGKVYVGAAGVGGDLYAFDGATGRLLWEQPVENGDHSAPTIGGGRVYVSYDCELTFAFVPATGAALWHHSNGCQGGGGRTSVFHGNELYIRDDSGMGPAVLNATTGTSVRAFTSTTAPAVGPTHTITQDGGVLRGLTNTGAILWTNTTHPWTSAPLLVNGLAVAGDASGVVSALDARNGRQLWTASVGTPIPAPDEHNPGGLVGLAEGTGHLVVPAGTTLTVFRSAS